MDCLESKLAAAAKQWCGALQEKDDGHKRGVYHPAFDLKMLDLTLKLTWAPPNALALSQGVKENIFCTDSNANIAGSFYILSKVYGILLLVFNFPLIS